VDCRPELGVRRHPGNPESREYKDSLPESVEDCGLREQKIATPSINEMKQQNRLTSDSFRQFTTA
jgi:hypothetical protein